MNLCTCGHAETAHANGTGFCYADKRNGDPCECNRYTPEVPTPAAEPEQVTSGQYIGQAEREELESALLRIAALTATRHGELPDVLVFCLCNREQGDQLPIKFELMCSLWTWAGGEYRMWYEAAGPFEFAGVPSQDWRVAL